MKPRPDGLQATTAKRGLERLRQADHPVNGGKSVSPGAIPQTLTGLRRVAARGISHENPNHGNN